MPPLPYCRPVSSGLCGRREAAILTGYGAEDRIMPEIATIPAPRLSRPLLIVAGVSAILLAMTGALWVHYGTAVFYEMIVAGIAACF